MKSILGIDIGSKTVKLIEIAQDKAVSTLLSAGSMPLPPRQSATHSEADLEAIAMVVRQLVKETGAKSEQVNIALPESQVFTRVIDVPPLSRRELMTAIQWEAEQYIPLPLDQVNMDFTVLRDAKETGTGKMEVLLVAAPKTLVEKYLEIMDLADLYPIGAETDIIAGVRAIVRTVPTIKNVMVATLGAQTTDISIVCDGVIAFTRSISAGGDSLTRALVQSLEFTEIQAEEYKKAYGLQKNILEGKIFAALSPIMNTVLTEMKRSIAFFEQKNQGKHVEAVILNGGTAKLPGLVGFVTETLSIETQLANPWTSLARDSRFSVLNTEGPLFSIAVGLALR